MSDLTMLLCPTCRGIYGGKVMSSHMQSVHGSVWNDPDALAFLAHGSKHSEFTRTGGLKRGK